MKPQPNNNPFHNPFYNRFNDPVKRRLDDMQSHEYTRWLAEKTQALSLPLPVLSRPVKDVSDEAKANQGNRTVTSILVLFVVFLVSAVLLVKAW